MVSFRVSRVAAVDQVSEVCQDRPRESSCTKQLCGPLQLAPQSGS